MNPRVTIVTPAYKRIDYLREALLSALGQTIAEFELIVSDDSNSPEIKALCESFQDGRIRYIPRETNLGIGLNNREAIRAASCDLIAKLDDDDVWESDFLEKLLPVIEQNPGLGIVFSDHWIIDDKGEIQAEASENNIFNQKRAKIGQGIVKDKKDCVLYDNSIPVAMASIFRRSAINLDKWEAAYGGAYDRWISGSIAASNYEMYHYAEKLTRYRIHGGSGTATRRRKNLEESLAVWTSFAADRAWASHLGAIKHTIAMYSLYIGRLVAAHEGARSASIFFSRSLRMSFSFKAFVCYVGSRFGLKI